MKNKILILFTVIFISSTNLNAAHAGYGGTPGGFGVTVSLFKDKYSHHSICSGTAIAPKVVVTAGHCLINSRYLVGQPDKATFVTEKRIGIQSYKFMHVTEPMREAKIDIGVIYLKKSLKIPSVKVATQSQIKDWAKENRQAFIVGYGFDKYTNSFSDSLPTILMGYVASFRGNVTEIGFEPPIGICSGDSGGSAVVIENGYIYYIGAVVSGNTNACDPTWEILKENRATVFNWSYYKNDL